LTLHKTTDGLKHIKKARNVTDELLTSHTCEMKTIPGDNLVHLIRECHYCAKLNDSQMLHYRFESKAVMHKDFWKIEKKLSLT